MAFREMLMLEGFQAGLAWSFILRKREGFRKAMKRRGFKFVGPTTVYAWTQALGIVNDRADACFRRKAALPGGRT